MCVKTCKSLRCHYKRHKANRCKTCGIDFRLKSWLINNMVYFKTKLELKEASQKNLNVNFFQKGGRSTPNFTFN